jgi:mycothiol synthase
VDAAVDLRELDLDSASEADLRAAHAVAAPALWHHVAGDEPMPFEEWLAEERKRRTIVATRHVVADRAGEVVGHGYVELDGEGNTHLAWIQLAVAPTHRRQGIGTALLGRLADIGAGDGRTSMGCGADEGSCWETFLADLGITHRQTVHLNRLRIADLDRTLLEEWVDRAPERAGGYRLLAWDGPTPDEHAEAFAVCTEVMNTAPLGDLEVEHERMTVARLRRLEGARADAGVDWWTLVAVEEATGAFVGFTQLSFSGWRDVHAKQQDTGVDPAHRDRGLGRWLKASMLLRLLDEKPAVIRIDTGNAGSNAPMLSINHALGFRPAKVSGNWQGDLDTVRKHLSERP